MGEESRPRTECAQERKGEKVGKKVPLLLPLLPIGLDAWAFLPPSSPQGSKFRKRARVREGGGLEGEDGGAAPLRLPLFLSCIILAAVSWSVGGREGRGLYSYVRQEDPEQVKRRKGDDRKQHFLRVRETRTR